MYRCKVSQKSKKSKHKIYNVLISQGLRQESVQLTCTSAVHTGTLTKARGRYIWCGIGRAEAEESKH